MEPKTFFSLIVALIAVYTVYVHFDVSFVDQHVSLRKREVHPSAPSTRDVYLVVSGDSRESANLLCWPAQEEMERKLKEEITSQGYNLIRSHDYDPRKKHGFIDSQRMGINVMRSIPPDARVIVAESVWQYSHHVLAGLRTHQGPILTVANWEGKWPGLVGLLNLNAGLTKIGKAYSTLWSKDFKDGFFRGYLRKWLRKGYFKHDKSHVTSFDILSLSGEERDEAEEIAAAIQDEKVIFGVFDEGSMGMYNAIIDDEYLNPMGFYKERLSQSSLYARMLTVPDSEAKSVLEWLKDKGMNFHFGNNPDSELTEVQVLEQCKMYIAAVHIAEEYGLDALGIQYQLGLKDLTAASDLAEGLLNNPERPPVIDEDKGEIRKGAPIPHFNEVDEGSAVDCIVTNRLWTRLGMDPSTTLHDLRYGEEFELDGEVQFVWVLEISGAAPASHHVGGYKGSHSYRQPPMYFPKGGGTLSGVAKPGHLVWSRVYTESGRLHVDIGRATSVELPAKEVQRRLDITTKEWPIMNVVLHGVSRDQMMAQHKSNHIQVVYAPTEKDADRALKLKAGVFHNLRIEVHLCGVQ